jgi:hypothetical protein
MRFKLTILLFLFNIALFLTLFYMDKTEDTARAFAESNSLVLKPGSVEQANALELDGPGAAAHWLVQRDGQDWRMTRPQQWPVNAYAIRNILDQLRFLRMETRFPVSDIESTGMTLADYGLDNPSVILRIGAEGKETLLRIGAPTKVGARLYVLSPDGESVFVTSRDILRALLVGLDDLRDGRIFNIPSFMATSLSMQRADGAKVRLTKLGIGWEFESPIRVDADDTAVDSLLAEMEGLKVRAFVSADPSAQGLLSPRLRIGIESAEDRQSLLIGSEAGNGLVYAKLENSPEVFTMDATIVERFQKAQEDLRERYFSRLNKNGLGEIRVTMNGQTATLQKLETGEWQVLRPSSDQGIQTWKADPAIVKDLIDSVNNLYAIRFVSDAPSEADLEAYGFKNPQREVTLQTSKSATSIVIGGREDKLGGVYVRTASDPFVYEVASGILGKLNPTALHYRTRELESLPPAASVKGLSLTRIADAEAVINVAPKDNEDWDSAIAQATKNADEAALVHALLDYAKNGRAEAFIADSCDDSITLGDGRTCGWTWRLDAAIELPSGTTQTERRTISYLFTDRIAGTTQYGGSRELGLMFSLPQAFIDTLHKLTERRAIPTEKDIPPAPESVQPETKPDVQAENKEAGQPEATR